MRLVADLVRGQKVERALNILRFSSKEASRKLEKLVLSVLPTAKKTLKLIWKKLVYLLKRYSRWWNDVEKTSSSPQGRAHRIRKRSNHVTIVLDLLITHNLIQDGTKDKSNWK
jgi:large subunit ribosomal protein L22